LKRRIISDGFLSPFFIWKHDEEYSIIDGTQRRKVLLLLRDEGYEIPLLPVVYIEARNATEARRILLSITSQYGEFARDQLDEWLAEIDEDIKNTFNLVGFEEEERTPSEKEEDDGGCKITVSELGILEAAKLFEELRDRGLKCKLKIST
jgi:ParB-like chromosome segregation protein Spo0J